MPEALPAGFRRKNGGLIVPEALSRVREVWVKDEWKLLERATKMLASHHVIVYLHCDFPTCQAEPLRPSRLPDGSFRLQCTHADRVMTKAL